MLPATLQFIIAMIAYSINERLQRKLDYVQEEVRVLKEVVRTLGRRRIPHYPINHRHVSSGLADVEVQQSTEA